LPWFILSFYLLFVHIPENFQIFLIFSQEYFAFVSVNSIFYFFFFLEKADKTNVLFESDSGGK